MTCCLGNAESIGIVGEPPVRIKPPTDPSGEYSMMCQCLRIGDLEDIIKVFLDSSKCRDGDSKKCLPVPQPLYLPPTKDAIANASKPITWSKQ